MLYNLIPLQEATQSNPYTGIIMIVVLIGIFYFFMIRPQQKRQKEIRKFREGLWERCVHAGKLAYTFKDEFRW